MMRYEEVMERLKSLSNMVAVAGMARYGISTTNTYGISIPHLRNIAREIGKNHSPAQELWSSGIDEARILASMVDKPDEVTEAQVEDWVKDFDSWDVCDQCCANLFARTTFAYQKAVEWSSREEEFIKRAGFALMEVLAVHDKNGGDADFWQFLPLIQREAIDHRNFVKKAVNWALRQIGKRNLFLNVEAIETAQEIQKINSPSAKWIASGAIRKLESESVPKRLRK